MFVFAVSRGLPFAQLDAAPRVFLSTHSESICLRHPGQRKARRARTVRGASTDEDAHDSAKAEDSDRHRKSSESPNRERLQRSQQKDDQISPLSWLWEFLWQPIALTPPVIAGALIILWASISGVAAVSQMLSERASGTVPRLPLLSLKSGALTRNSQGKLDIPDDRLVEVELNALTLMQDRQNP